MIESEEEELNKQIAGLFNAHKNSRLGSEKAIV